MITILLLTNGENHVLRDVITDTIVNEASIAFLGINLFAPLQDVQFYEGRATKEHGSSDITITFIAEDNDGALERRQAIAETLQASIEHEIAEITGRKISVDVTVNIVQPATVRSKLEIVGNS